MASIQGKTQEATVGGEVRRHGGGAAGVRSHAPLLAAVASRTLDVTGALLLLVVTAPLFALAALAVYLDSGRPIFFAHVRLGRGGQRFRCWKLRTMDPDAERALEQAPALRRRHRENGYKLPSDDDPRVTRVGRFLRRRYLDELPQILNVLAGSMALVGPRPVIPQELEEYGAHGAEVLSVRPGLTGAWTSRGALRPGYPERARVELEYVRTRSLRGDLGILARSARVVLRGQGHG